MFSSSRLARLWFVVGIGVLSLGSGWNLGSGAALAQGILVASESETAFRLPRPLPRPPIAVPPISVPRPEQPGVLYDVARLEIDASIRDQVAEVQVAQTFRNLSSSTLQVRFVFPLPYDGAIDQMTFLVDGQELEGRLLEADRAREIYQSYVRRSRDPALVQWIGSGMFQTEVFPVPAGAERTVSLRYTQLCRRSGQLNDWLLPLVPARFSSRPVAELAIRGRIRSETKLGNVYSPSHPIKIEREGDRIVRFQYEGKQQIPQEDFRLLWDVGEEPVQMGLVSYRPDSKQDGYFLLMIQPQMPQPPAGFSKQGKNLVLILDKSGSMRGEKIDQARRATREVIGRLKGRDRFALITYDSKVETFRSELTAAEKATRVDAVDYIDSTLAGGSTNIAEALSQGLTIAGQADGPVYVVFVTDGQPTVGEKNSMKIAANVEQWIQPNTRLFSLGVGHDVNGRLLDKLARISLGQTTYVRPGQPLDEVITGLWDRLGSPALTDAKLQILVDGKQGGTRQLYPSEMYDLFSGDQLVIVGRYRKPGTIQIQLSGDYLGKRQDYSFEDELPKETGSGKNVFVERLWATRRIGQIIDEIDLHGESRELVDELITLSKRHGILTPYTAYLAEERTDLNDVQRGRSIATDELRRLQEEAGESGFRQRSLKSSLMLAERAAGGAGSAALPAITAEAVNADGLSLDDSIGVGGAETVSQIGSKTFYLRDGCYIDSEATDQQIAQAKAVEQFSDEYFALLERCDERDRVYFAQDRELLVVLNGKAFRIKPARS